MSDWRADILYGGLLGTMAAIPAWVAAIAFIGQLGSD